jgi:hypothetical protein
VTEIGKIISQLEHQRASIERAIAALREIDSPSEAEALTPPAASKKATGKRQISPEGRKRIAEATRQRWAAKKAAAVSETSSEKVSVRKRRLSPEGRKRIVEATKRRWAAKRAAEASKTSGSPKTAPMKRGARSTKTAAS